MIVEEWFASVHRAASMAQRTMTAGAFSDPFAVLRECFYDHPTKADPRIEEVFEMRSLIASLSTFDPELIRTSPEIRAAADRRLVEITQYAAETLLAERERNPRR